MTRSSSDFLNQFSLQRLQIGVALLLTALSVVLHGGFMLHHYPLWRDEVNSVGLAAMPTLRDLWMSLSYDSSPALWPFLLRLWMFYGPGDSDLSLRCLGFLVQMLLLGGLWFNALSMGKRAPILSLWLLGCQPAIVLWPALRSYGLGAALMLWTFGSLWRALENPTRRRLFATFALALLSVQCVYVNLLILGAICAGGVGVCFYRGQKKRAWLPCAVLLVAALSILIYVPTLMRIAPWQMITAWDTTFRYVLASFVATLRAPINLMVWIWIALFAVFLLGTPFVIVAARRKSEASTLTSEENAARGQAALYAFIVSVLSLAVMVVFFQRAQRSLYPWHFVGLMALLASCLDFFAAAIIQNSKMWLLGLVGATVLALSTFSFSQQDVASPRTNIDIASDYLGKHARPDDLIVIMPFHYGVTYQRYAKAKTQWVAAPDIGEYRIQRYDILKKRMETPNSLARVENLIGKALQSGHRVWLLGAFREPPLNPPRYVLPDDYGKGGWFCPRYEGYCLDEIAYFLEQNGTNRLSVPLPKLENQNPLEIAQLEVVSGFRTAAAP